jgi:hypothetical protein
VPSLSAGLSPSLTACLAALRASEASFLEGARK